MYTTNHISQYLRQMVMSGQKLVKKNLMCVCNKNTCSPDMLPIAVDTQGKDTS